MQEDDKPDGVREFEEILSKADGGEKMILLAFMAMAFGKNGNKALKE